MWAIVPAGDRLKRMVDLIAAMVGLVLASPALVAIAALVLIDSGTPVIYRQTRVGLHGEVFEMLKFRTMQVGVDRLGFRTRADDPRVTRLGRLLRRTSLDELPQLVNVVRGEMSLVGPRPDVPEQLDDYDPADLELRVSVRPGITGLAQATRRSEATPSERLALDLAYVSDRSFSLDLRIVLATLRSSARAI